MSQHLGTGAEYYAITCGNGQNEQETHVVFYLTMTAIIQKMMINPETQHVVIACLWILDDGRTKTTEIYFFTHFHIDPQEVERIENNNSLWAVSDDSIGT